MGHLSDTPQAVAMQVWSSGKRAELKLNIWHIDASWSCGVNETHFPGGRLEWKEQGTKEGFQGTNKVQEEETRSGPHQGDKGIVKCEKKQKNVISWWPGVQRVFY